MAKLNLPSNGTLSDISDYYTLLYGTANKTSTGNVRFPVSGSSRAGYVYDTTGTYYANQGQVGMLNLLTFGDSLNGLYSNPKMEDYITTAEEYNDIVADIALKADTTVVDTKAQYKKGRGFFPASNTVYTLSDSFLTGSSQVIISPLLEKQGTWSVATNSEYTPPSTRLLHLDNNVTDAAGATWTNSSATFSAINSFSGYAAYFTGGTKIYTAASADFTIAGDFMIDFWMRYEASISGSARYVAGNASAGSATDGTIRFTKGSADTIEGRISIGGTPYAIVSSALTADTFYHIELSRTSGVLYLFINGVLQDSLAASGTLAYVANTFALGTNGAYASSTFTGYIDEFHFSNGFGGHTTSFTPPTAPYRYDTTFSDVGSFTITSDATETSIVPFDWGATK